MEIYFVPGIGPAPKWASFLENITEELEETKNYSVYEDHKFLTYGDLEQIGATNLIGTNFIKPYMHGYFMDWKLYKKLKTLNEPFDYNKYLEERKQEKLNKMFEGRIVMNRNQKMKVNQKLAENLTDKDESKNVLVDPRFKSLFTDKNFEVDFNSEQYKGKNLYKNKQTDITNNNLTNENGEGNNVVEEKVEKIVNPELVKLKEKLLSRKRKKIDKLY